MTRTAHRFLMTLALAAGCRGADDPRPPDAGRLPDAGRPVDAAPVDAAPVDAAGELPLAGFGDLTGDCDVLDDELVAVGPSAFTSHLLFASPFTAADVDLLTAGGQEVLADDNAGGSSLLSEVFAFEVLARCERAALVKTETEIDYATEGKKTDLLVEIDGVRLGVSVTRAVAFPFDQPYPPAQASALLERKLADILLSTAGVAAADRWEKQVLAILAYADQHAAALADALADVDPAVRADTVVWVVISDGADDFIYTDSLSPGP